MDLNSLMQPLPVVENPGLETTDLRLEEASTLIQQAQYPEAAALAESVLAEGIYDIRMIGFLAYGVFLERGPGSLKEIFDCLAGLLRDNWPAIGPAPKREKHAQTTLRWIFNQLLKKLQYEENAKSELWEQWASRVTSDEVGEALDAADGLRRALTATLEDASAPLIDVLSKLTQWMQSFQQIVYKDEAAPEPEAEIEAEPEPSREEMEEVAAEVETRSLRTEASPQFQPSSEFSALEDGLVVEGSYLLKALLEKMEAFERLIAEEKFPRAALVADEIGQIIASFDPMLYFPKFFARYAYLKAVNFQELYSFEEQKETAEWQALKEFYKVDMKGFIES